MNFNISAFAGVGQQFFDNSGNVLTGGKLYTYQAGTTTPAPTFTTLAGNVAHTNPIILDSAGRVPGGEIWLDTSKIYKFVVTTSTDVLLNTYDNVVAIGFTSVNSFVSVTDFGAVGDGVTDDRDSLQAAIDFATANNIALYVPSGTYYVPNNKTALSFTGDLTMFGDGMYNSILYYDDSVQLTRRDFFQSSAAGNLNLRDLCLSCDWGSSGSYTQRSQMTEITSDGTGNAVVTSCRFTNSRYMSLILSNFNSATVTNCVFTDGAADGCRITNSQNVLVDGNQFSNINDDSIAVHTKDSEPSPAKSNIVISNNNIVDGQGIAVLGAKHATIIGNVLTRVQSRGIFVGQNAFGTTEGATSVVGVTVTGNTITDVFRGAVFSPLSGNDGGYIQIAGYELTDDGSGYVTYGDGSGGVVQPYPYLYTNGLTALTENAGNWFVNISNNVCARTLGPVANYSDYGYGDRLGRSGPVDPVILEASFDINQVYIRGGYVNSLNISDNVISGGIRYGIYLERPNVTPVNSRENVSITNNIITDISKTTAGNAGLYVLGKGIVKVEGNTFNIDPYNVQGQRLPNGKWSANFDFCSCIWVSEGQIVCSNNTFKNAGTVFRGATPSDHIWQSNTIIAYPVGLGANANNIGIRNISSPNSFDAKFIIEDGDPASVTFNNVLNTCATEADVLPTSGYYVAGLFVRSRILSVQGTLGSQYIVNGWIRLTTGSAHVLNTDWAEARTLTGT